MSMRPLQFKHSTHGAILQLKIASGHKLLGIPSPTHNSLVTSVREGARRHAPRERLTKAPFAPDLVRQVVDAYVYDSGSLQEFQRGLMVLITYVAFLKASDFCALGSDDVVFHLADLQLFLPPLRRTSTATGGSSL